MAPSAQGEGMSGISSLELLSGYEESHPMTTAIIYLVLLHRVWYLNVPVLSCNETCGPQHKTKGTRIICSQKSLPQIVLDCSLSLVTIWGGLLPIALHKTCPHSLSRTILLQLKKKLSYFIINTSSSPNRVHGLCPSSRF